MNTQFNIEVSLDYEYDDIVSEGDELLSYDDIYDRIHLRLADRLREIAGLIEERYKSGGGDLLGCWNKSLSDTEIFGLVENIATIIDEQASKQKN
jgi:hypothetical protein